MLDRVRGLGAAKTLAVALVGYRPSVVELAAQRSEVDFIGARFSERSYVGRGTTDTGGRLFGTTTWGEPR